jgi:hypothetical protein
MRVRRRLGLDLFFFLGRATVPPFGLTAPSVTSRAGLRTETRGREVLRGFRLEAALRRGFERGFERRAADLVARTRARWEDTRAAARFLLSAAFCAGVPKMRICFGDSLRLCLGFRRCRGLALVLGRTRLRAETRRAGRLGLTNRLALTTWAIAFSLLSVSPAYFARRCRINAGQLLLLASLVDLGLEFGPRA